MREIEAHGIILRLAQGKRNAPAIILAADENVVCFRWGGATDQAVDHMQISVSRSAAPIVEGLGTAYLGIDAGLLIRR